MLVSAFFHFALPDAVSQFDVLLNFFLEFLFVISGIDMMVEYFFADPLVFLFDLLQLPFVEVPVASRDILILVTVVSLD